jgi:inorganic triphosphatase YgiF
MPPPAHDIELKLTFDPADAARLRRHLSRQFSAQKPTRQTLVSVYFDTPDLALREAGLSLQVRRVGRRSVQTVKASGVSAADRGEWEYQVGKTQPDPEVAKDSPLAALLDGRGAEALRPVFESRIRRTAYQVTVENTEMALAVDQGEVDSGQDRAPLCEIDLQLQRGEPAELFRLARELSNVVPLRFAVASKSDHGYALLVDGKEPIEYAADVHLAPTTSCADAFRIIARSGVRQLAANEPQMRPDRPSALHQMRIGLRRVRAALSLFKDIATDGERDRVRDELKWLAAMLGPARDLDVFVAEVLEPLHHEHPDHPGLAEVVEEIEARRQRAYAEATAACRSARYQARLLTTAEWIESGSWRVRDDALLRARRELPIATLAADELARRRRKILKTGNNLRGSSPPDRHQVRIRGKKLRYATEFFKDVFPGKRSTRRREALLSALKDLQDSLGGLNDIATRTDLALEIAKHDHGRDPSGGERAFAAGMIVGRQDARRKRLLDAAERSYREIADSKPFWT